MQRALLNNQRSDFHFRLLGSLTPSCQFFVHIPYSGFYNETVILWFHWISYSIVFVTWLNTLCVSLISSHHGVMSIFNYFKTQSKTLLTPIGTLSSSIPSHAIVTANHMVSVVVSNQSRNPKQKHRRKATHNNSYSPQKWVKQLLQFGATAAVRKYSAKLGTTMNESTMCVLFNKHKF